MEQLKIIIEKEAFKTKKEKIFGLGASNFLLKTYNTGTELDKRRIVKLYEKAINNNTKIKQLNKAILYQEPKEHYKTKEERKTRTLELEKEHKTYHKNKNPIIPKWGIRICSDLPDLPD